MLLVGVTPTVWTVGVAVPYHTSNLLSEVWLRNRSKFYAGQRDKAPEIGQVCGKHMQCQKKLTMVDCVQTCAWCDYKRKIFQHLGEQGWRSGESTRLPPMWPGFDSRTRRHMWVEFVVGSLLCSERFFSGYSGFPLSAKTNISKFQSGMLERLIHEPLAREIGQPLLTLSSLNKINF